MLFSIKICILSCMYIYMLINARVSHIICFIPPPPIVCHLYWRYSTESGWLVQLWVFHIICLLIYSYTLIYIILIAPTVTGLQYLLNVCESELVKLDMCINISKSMCIRLGPRFNKPCSELKSINGGRFKWVWQLSLSLGVSSRWSNIQMFFDQAKSKFFRAFNAVNSNIDSTV